MNSQQPKTAVLTNILIVGLVASIALFLIGGVGYGFGTAVGTLLSLIIVWFMGQQQATPPTQPEPEKETAVLLQKKLHQAEAAAQTNQTQLVQLQQAIANEQNARSRFWRHISHELRTPLNGIINFSHMISLGFYGDVTPKQTSYLSRIEQSGWYLLTMLNDLSDMAKIESNDFQLNRSKIDLETTCEEALATLHSIITDDEVRIIRDYPDSWPTLHADERRLKQVLINLLRFSAKQVEEGYIALRVQPDAPWLHLLIEDTSDGLPAAQQANFFPPMGTEHPPLMLQSDHIEFGLAVANYLIEAHGGKITIKSAPGQGCLFTITLPLTAS